MKFNQVFVVLKKSSGIQKKTQNTDLLNLSKKSPELYHQILEQKTSHINTYNHICNVLAKHKIPHRTIYRHRLFSEINDVSPDLIITVGGDGTVLAASHLNKNIPILGVNSAPKVSKGFFCEASERNFEHVLNDIIDKKIKLLKLPLLEISIDGKKANAYALNDALFTSVSPAETVQYTLIIEGKKQRQKSSGLWIAAGPGSTAAIKSAGGKAQKITSKKIQYMVRELCFPEKQESKFHHGFIKYGKSLKLITESSYAIIYLDGNKTILTAKRASIIEIKIANEQALIYLRKKC